MNETKHSSLPGVSLSGDAADEITRRDFLNEVTLGALGIAGMTLMLVWTAVRHTRELYNAERLP